MNKCHHQLILSCQQYKKYYEEDIEEGHAYIDFPGRVNIWKVGQVGELARRTAHFYFGSGNDFDYTKKYLFFMVACHYAFTPAFYKQQHIYNPLRYVYSTPHMGRSSYTEYQECFAVSDKGDDGELIHTETVHVVTVDSNTRKPIPLPDPVVEFLSPLYSPERSWKPPPKVEPQPRPDTIKPSGHLVKWSNADYYRHSNHTQYLKYAMDGIWDAGLEGSEMFSGVQGLYRGETNPGDNLLLYAWEAEKGTIHVHVDKSANSDGSETVFQGTFKLDDSSNSGTE